MLSDTSDLLQDTDIEKVPYRLHTAATVNEVTPDLRNITDGGLFLPSALLPPAGPRAGLPLEPGLQHCEARDQPEDSVQKFGRCGQSCAAGHQRHRQPSRWS